MKQGLQHKIAVDRARPWLAFEDDTLLAECRLEAFRGSGPGGQKRNKTSSAVRLVHEPTGLSVRSEESRSQKSNRKSALLRLRMEIALHVRAEPAPIDLNTARARNPPDVARVLDHLDTCGYSVSGTAVSLGATTGALSSFVCANEMLLSEVNRQRALRGLKPLRLRR